MAVEVEEVVVLLLELADCGAGAIFFSVLLKTLFGSPSMVNSTSIPGLILITSASLISALTVMVSMVASLRMVVAVWFDTTV